MRKTRGIDQWLLCVGMIIASLSLPLADERREIKILRQTPTELDRAISDHLCVSYEVLHPYHRCKELYIDQGILTKEELAGFDFIITSEQFFNDSLVDNFALVLPLYQQSFTIVAHEDIEPKRIFHPELRYGVIDQSYQASVLDDVLKAVGTNSGQLNVVKAKNRDLIERFCSYDLNVVFITGAHPNRVVRQLNTLCDGKPLSVVDFLPAKFFKKHRYFYQTTVPKEYYWRIDKDIDTLGVRYLLAVNNRLQEAELDRLMISFMKELDYNRQLPITERSIVHNAQNLQTPLHEIGRELIEKLQVTEKADVDNAEAETNLMKNEE